MRDHTSNSALILFFFCEGHPRRSIVSIMFVDKFKSFPSLFFNFLSPISFIAAHLCGSFLLLNNIHCSKYYSFQLIVNKQTNKQKSYSERWRTWQGFPGLKWFVVTFSLPLLLYYAISRLNWTAAAVMCFTGQAVVGRSHARATQTAVVFCLQIGVVALKVIVVGPSIIVVTVTFLRRSRVAWIKQVSFVYMLSF